MGAFASATNDIASDGMYLIALKPDQQSFFVGLRGTFYRIGMITGQGLIVIIAGYLETSLGDNSKAWSYTMIIVGALMLLLTAINFLTTPKVEEESKVTNKKEASFAMVFSTFFTKRILESPWPLSCFIDWGISVGKNGFSIFIRRSPNWWIGLKHF
ncbi:hypothetical protein V8V91_09515 [Algoriphagus halophilus]|uniref:hypothetical protein n=1 Tax=Algoriphagus halophilus TaxID=226505 RepID=UPI00358EBFCA